MIALNSSCLSGVDYDPVTRRMEIHFQSGRYYTLTGVPEHHFHGLVTASSPGAYFNTHLKGRY